MPSLLVIIRRNKWFNAGQGSTNLPADCLYDLRTTDNELSTWFVEDDQSNLERVLTAFAATRETLSNIDYILFDYKVPSSVGIAIRKTKGGTPDKDANSSWHHDLVQLSGQKLVQLAVEVYRTGSTGRLLDKKVGELIRAGVEAQTITRTLLKPKLAAKLFPSGTQSSLKSKLERCLSCIREIFSPAK